MYLCSNALFCLCVRAHGCPVIGRTGRCYQTIAFPSCPFLDYFVADKRIAAVDGRLICTRERSKPNGVNYHDHDPPPCVGLYLDERVTYYGRCVVVTRETLAKIARKRLGLN